MPELAPAGRVPNSLWPVLLYRVVLPAGTERRLLAGDAGFGVVGACPDGRDRDLFRADQASDDGLWVSTP